MKSIFELKTAVGQIGDELASVTDDLTSKLANPMVPKDDLDVLRSKKVDLQGRFDDLKSELDKAETAQIEELKKDPNNHPSGSRENSVAARASYYRSMLKGDKPKKVPAEVTSRLNAIFSTRSQLQAIPAGGGTGGENFLPTQLAQEIITEPAVVNELREVIRISNIKGLERSKILFTVDDDDFVTDAETANEMDATGDKVTFGRFKTKVKVVVSDSVISGSDQNLVSEVENGLRSGLAAKEKKVTFSVANVAAEKHMSFYEVSAPGVYAIKEVAGDTLYEAITNSIADLPATFRANAVVVMKYTDYVAMLPTLANGNATLYTAQPEQVIGKRVIFCDEATIPIVGAPNYCELNYDGDVNYDTDKDVDAGEYLFVLTAWFDQQRHLNSAFRLAVVEESV